MSRLFYASILVFLLGCGAFRFSGASEPTDHTFKLTADDIAYVESDECVQRWVTGDAEEDLAKARELLKERRVKIVKGNPIAMATALKRKLLVSDKFDAMTDEGEVVLLSHELVHYCHRDEQGSEFDMNYLHSAGRWRTETAAYLQGFRSMLLLCTPIGDVEDDIEKRLVAMRNMYLLWDIDPQQYVAETRRIWRSALIVPEHC